MGRAAHQGSLRAEATRQRSKEGRGPRSPSREPASRASGPHPSLRLPHRLTQLPNSSANRIERLCSSPLSSRTFVREVAPPTRSTSARRRPKALATAFRTASVAAPSTGRAPTRTIRTPSWPPDPSPYCPPTLVLEAPGLTRTLTLIRSLSRATVGSCCPETTERGPDGGRSGGFAARRGVGTAFRGGRLRVCWK